MRRRLQQPTRGAQALTRPSPSLPPLTASAVCGFASFLSLLAHHDFASEPLLLETDSPFTTELRDKAAAAFADARARAKGASAGATASSSPSAALARSNPTQTGTSASEVVVWIATPQEVEGSACCFDRSPSAQTVSRLRSVASACLSQLDTLATTSASGLEYQDAVAATSAAAVAAAAKDTTAATKDAASAAVAATDRASAALMSACFDAPLGQYDLLLELKPSKLPRSHLEWVGSAAAAARGDGRAPIAREHSQFANLQHGKVGLGLGHDPVAQLVRELDVRYGSLALFTHDTYGGRQIGVRWRPSAFLPKPLKPATSQHRMVIPRVGANAEAKQGSPGTPAKPSGGAAPWMLPNVPNLITEMCEVGGELVRRASIPRGLSSTR